MAKIIADLQQTTVADAQQKTFAVASKTRE